MQDQLLTVLCANIGWKWPDVWVYRLRNMVEKHTSGPLRFRCITDRSIPGIDCVPLSRPVHLDKDKPQGCWAKLDFFRREVSGDGPCIGLDLDVVIRGDLRDLPYSEILAAGTDPRSKLGQKYMNSSVMTWIPSPKSDAIYVETIPDRFVKGVSRGRYYPNGDQEYIADKFPEYTLLPDVHSYKGAIRQNPKLLETAKVVFFHGVPTPASPGVQFSWVRKTWEGLERLDRKGQ